MESNNNNPNNNYPTFQETFKPAQIDQSDPLGVYTGNPAPNSSQIYEKPTFQNPNPQPTFQNPNPQPQMNNYPNYYQNQPPQGQPTPNQQYMNQNLNMNSNYQQMPAQPMMSQPPMQQRPPMQQQPMVGQPNPNAQGYKYVPNSSVYNTAQPQVRPVMNTNANSRYPNGIVPPSGSIIVNPVPIVPVPVYTTMPMCMRCGGTGYIYGKRCVCIGGTPGPSNAELLGLGLMGMGLGYGRYHHHHHHGYW